MAKGDRRKEGGAPSKGWVSVERRGDSRGRGHCNSGSQMSGRKDKEEGLGQI